MELKNHKPDEIRVLYNISPKKVKDKINEGDKIFTDDDWLPTMKEILEKCEFDYTVDTTDLAGKNIHEIIIK